MTFPSPLSRQEGVDHYIAEGSYGLMSTIERKSGYVNWGQVAGNFDGDGSVIPVIEYYSLLFHLTWSDAYLPQVEQLKTFLEHEGFRPTKVVSGSTVYFLPLNRQSDVLTAAKMMIPLVYKKRYDLETVVEYLENRITGSEAIERLNESVRAGRRSARIRYVHMPFLRNEGAYSGRVLGARRAARTRTALGDEEKQEIIKQKETGISVKELVGRYGVSKDTIYKALKKHGK
jgi:hypothetical protein